MHYNVHQSLPPRFRSVDVRQLAKLDKLLTEVNKGDTVLLSVQCAVCSIQCSLCSVECLLCSVE